MATNDLMTELQKDSIKLDDDSERKVSLRKKWNQFLYNCLCWVTFEQTQVLIDWQVVRMILKLLEDKNGEVQNLAVKW